MLKPEQVEKLVAALKEKIGAKVKLAVHLEVRDESIGNMDPQSEARHSGSEIEITFLGVYGLGSRPMYIHGVDEKGKVKIFRNDQDVWVDENTSCSTHQDCTTLTNIDDVDIVAWFKEAFVCLAEEGAFAAKVAAAEPDAKYLAERILKGQPNYCPPGRSPRYYPSYFTFENPWFVEKALAYLDRIV